MSLLLAVDPGMNAPGVALFRDRLLVAAAPVRVLRSLSKLDKIERCREVAKLIRDWYVEWVRDNYAGMPADRVVCEYPQIYTAGKSKGDPNDLPPMVGIDVGLACLLPGVPFKSYLPREWTGQVPKAESGDPWASPRGIRVWERLSESERGCVTKITHDVVDAIGLGLHDLGRFAPRRW